MKPTKKNNNHWKIQLHEIIFEADTKEGKLFDITLIIVILCSILLVMLESVDSINQKYNPLFNILEWIITVFFTIEYFARIISIKKPSKYIFSFYGIVDLLSTIPKYLAVFLGGGAHTLIALRALRLLRIFRILKLTRYLGASQQLSKAIRASRGKILVFVTSILILTIILGTIMYLVESDESGFNSIPRSMYWAIITLTTVGYGDITPHSAIGQFIASVVMILGYGIIAVPTGIVTSELTKSEMESIEDNTQHCSNCSAEKHKNNAQYCYKCGEELNHE